MLGSSFVYIDDAYADFLMHYQRNERQRDAFSNSDEDGLIQQLTRKSSLEATLATVFPPVTVNFDP